MAGDWIDEQNDAVVSDYFAMLADDIGGRPYLPDAPQADLMPSRGRLDAARMSSHALLSQPCFIACVNSAPFLTDR